MIKFNLRYKTNCKVMYTNTGYGHIWYRLKNFINDGSRYTDYYWGKKPEIEI